MSAPPSFSIVICSDGRRDALAQTLRSLDHLDHLQFEVCVVHGPTPDGTRELLDGWRGRIKSACHPERNLCAARNIGIALAAGDIVAFLDDDAIPEPEWLRDLAQAYTAADVGGAGGFVYSDDGFTLQAGFVTLNRLGTVRDWDRPTPELNFPLSAEFPHLLGTNCSFRRDALIAIGGFDERIGRFLDESDVCCRMIDAGWTVRQVAGAYVHHKRLADALRTDDRVVRQWYELVKNKLYFPLLNARAHYPVDAVVEHVMHFTNHYAADTERAIADGVLPETDRERFRDEVARGRRDGLSHGFGRERMLIAAQTLERHRRAFLPFATVVPPGGRKTFCFLTQDYPPARAGGIARGVHQVARTVAARGHHVHVLTRGAGRHRVDVEDGVWVHRMVPVDVDPVELPGGLRAPAHIWNHSATMLREIERISSHRPVDCVYAPLWDCEGLAVAVDGRFRLLTALQTPLHSFLEANPQLKADEKFMREFAVPMLALEKLVIERSAAVRPNSAAIAADISRHYGLALTDATVVPHGLDDWRELPATAPSPLPAGAIRILFAGRIEARKGVDVLLEAAGTLLARHPQVHLDLVGNDRIASPDGRTYRDAFDGQPVGAPCSPWRDRVRFHGEVADEALRGFYRAADIFVAPSRYESFGLVLLEAMMFAKPVVSCRSGGIPEVVADVETGLLAQPGDAASLAACLEFLILDPALRRRMGERGRERYERLFTAERMTEGLLAALSAVASPQAAPTACSVGAPDTRATAKRTTVAGSDRKRVRVAVIAPVIVRHDAISTSVLHTVRALDEAGGFDVTTLTLRNDLADVAAQTVRGVGDMMLHPAFLAADLAIAHFGIYSPLFDALIERPGVRQIVGFHNITPPELMPAEQRPVIEASFRQLFNLRCADRIWAVSDTNADELRRRGFDPGRIEVIPLAVERPAPMRLAAKPAPPVEILFVGRIVPSKGAIDLIEAAALAARRCTTPFRLRLVGNLEYSDPAYVAEVRSTIARGGLAQVELIGTVSDARLDSLYAAAHVVALPSYHEGFGVPVIEALRAGAIPVGYAAHNTPLAAHGLGRMVAPGDRAALAAALVDLIGGVAGSAGAPDRPSLALDGGAMSRSAFDRAAHDHAEKFTFGRIAPQMLRSIDEVLRSAPAPAQQAWS